MKLILTESDMQTIDNALCAVRDDCWKAAENPDCDPKSKEAFEQSAEKYEELRHNIAMATAIEVQL